MYKTRHKLERIRERSTKKWKNLVCAVTMYYNDYTFVEYIIDRRNRIMVR